MSLAALQAIDDAIDATQRFLVPFDRIRWFRMAAIMLFVAGGGMSFTYFPFGGSPGDGGTPGDGGPGTPPGQAGPSLTPELTPELLVFVVALVALVVAVGLLWGMASGTMEFVFVESLGREEINLRSYFKRHWWRGVRLYGFRLGVWLLTFGGIALTLLLVGTLLGGWPPTGWADDTVIAVVLLAIPVGLVSVVVVGILLGFTTMFVVPVMLTEDRGVLSAWRRFSSTLAGNLTEYLAYLVVSVLLGFVVGMAVSLLLIAVLLIIGIPALILAIPAILLFVVGAEAIGGMLLLVVFLLAAVLAFVASLLVQVPFQTYLRYYALFVLGDTNPSFDVIPDTRAAVRADGGTDSGDGDDGTDGESGADDRDGGDGDSDGETFDRGDGGGDGGVLDRGDDGDGGGDGDDSGGDWNVDR